MAKELKAAPTLRISPGTKSPHAGQVAGEPAPPAHSRGEHAVRGLCPRERLPDQGLRLPCATPGKDVGIAGPANTIVLQFGFLSWRLQGPEEITQAGITWARDHPGDMRLRRGSGKISHLSLETR